MKLVFFGTSTFGIPALKRLASHVSLVVTQPDRPSGRGMRLQPSPVKLCALELGLRVESPEKSRSPEFVEILLSEQADALLVAAYGQILSTKVLESAKHGSINLHGSILPKYRGAAPIQRCLLDGETETGVTLMQMDKGMDTGDIITIDRLTIGPDETCGLLYDRLSDLAGDMAVDWMPRIVKGDYTRTPQPHDLATYAGKVEKADAELSFERPFEQEYNRFRAFLPSPGPFVSTKFGALRLHSMKRFPGDPPAPGTALISLGQLVAGFKDGALILEELQPEGKKRMRGIDFANGAHIRSGDCLL